MSVIFVDHISQAHIDSSGSTVRLATQTLGPDTLTGQPTVVSSSVIIFPIAEIDNLLDILQNARASLNPSEESQPTEETSHERHQNSKAACPSDQYIQPS